MRKLKNVVAVLLVMGLLMGSMPIGALAAESPSGYAVVLPAGEMLDDESLAEVTGEGFLTFAAGVVVGYVATKLADSAWERYVDPWLDDTFWPWVESFFEE